MIALSDINCINHMMGASSFWEEIAKNSVTGIFAMLGIAFAAYLAYKYVLMQKRYEIFTGLEKLKYERKLTALEGCWKMCKYMTDSENPKAILLWKQQKSGDKSYFIKKANAEEFIAELSTFFYSSGLGIYLSNEIKNKLFNYRGIIYGFVLKEKKNQDEIIQIKKPEVVKSLIDLHHSLVLVIKKETELIDKLKKK